MISRAEEYENSGHYDCGSMTAVCRMDKDKHAWIRTTAAGPKHYLYTHKEGRVFLCYRFCPFLWFFNYSDSFFVSILLIEHQMHDTLLQRHLMLKWRHPDERVITSGIIPHTTLRLYTKRRSQRVNIKALVSFLF
jgi:hypothetical protein